MKTEEITSPAMREGIMVPGCVLRSSCIHELIIKTGTNVFSDVLLKNICVQV